MIMSVNQQPSAPNNTWVLMNKSIAATVKKGTMTEILYHRHELARTSGVVITCKKINECKVSADRCHIQAHCIDTAYDHSDGCELDSDVD